MNASSQQSSARINRKWKQTTDFSKVGGLSNHIKILRDTIIIPLLHNNVYSYFRVKTPRGILFYGPPGTGKTLVAGALATELNKEGMGKVSFYQRKGADILDKYVGESEKKLKSLFDDAAKNRPSIIFFDELDGLAPIRNAQHDHVHYSVVTTLLALMDGLDSVPGVIVIGATNRIESVDPALRRSGRFDKELYFPLPSTLARKEILQVHMLTWRHKPLEPFLSYLAEITTGFCGSDLQALCTEALLCAMKRQCPNLHSGVPKVKIEEADIKITEDDFTDARKNLIPSAHKLGSRMRKLSSVVAPLLENQLNNILLNIKKLAPHFFAQFHKYLIGNERYIGRVVLVGSDLQGLNTNILPAILQNLEHLPAFFLDANALQNKTILKSLPSILVMPRIDQLWSCLDIYQQTYITSLLEDIHSGLPVLIIATYEEEMPLMLQNFFYNNTSLIINIEDPTESEVGNFFIPLFFGESPNSLCSVLLSQEKGTRKKSNEASNSRCGNSSNVYKLKPSGRISKTRSSLVIRKNVETCPDRGLGDDNQRNSVCTMCGSAEKKRRLSVILTDMVQRSIACLLKRNGSNGRKCDQRNSEMKQKFGDSKDVDKQKIYNLWRQTVLQTAKGMPVAHLEVVYDTILACINIHKDNFRCLVKHLEDTLEDYESFNI